MNVFFTGCRGRSRCRPDSGGRRSQEDKQIAILLGFVEGGLQLRLMQVSGGTAREKLARLTVSVRGSFWVQGLSLHSQ